MLARRVLDVDNGLKLAIAGGFFCCAIVGALLPLRIKSNDFAMSLANVFAGGPMHSSSSPG